MLIDTHCHIDQYDSPEAIVSDCEKSRRFVVAVTNLPSHFAIAADRLKDSEWVKPALGLHPMAAKEARLEMGAFRRLARYADFVGEIGLDGSRHGIASLERQRKVFEDVLQTIGDRPRFITVHSRGAEPEVLAALARHKIGPVAFHWFTGTLLDLTAAMAAGHFVSINPAMLRTEKGLRAIEAVGRDRILAETDGPHSTVDGRPALPADVARVYEFLATKWDVSTRDVEQQIEANFNSILRSVAAGKIGR